MAILTEELSGQRAVTRLYRCILPCEDLQPVISDNRPQGPGIVSPDGEQIVLSMASPEHPAQYSLWLVALGSHNGKAQQITTAEPDGWDTAPSWKPDGREIIFSRIRRDRAGLHSKLMRLDLVHHTESEILGEQEGTAGAAYSRDGKSLAFWSKRGLEVLEIEQQERRVITPWSQIPHFGYYGGGLTWSKIDDQKLAFAMVNKLTNEYTIFIVLRDGSDMRAIYSVRKFKPMGVSFVLSR